jgi:hypothetical protein
LGIHTDGDSDFYAMIMAATGKSKFKAAGLSSVFGTHLDKKLEVKALDSS